MSTFTKKKVDYRTSCHKPVRTAVLAAKRSLGKTPRAEPGKHQRALRLLNKA